MEVLLAGNTGYLTQEFVHRAFPDCRVTVTGCSRLHTDRAAGILSLKQAGEDALRQLMDSQPYDRVVWFASSLTAGGGSFDELEPLRAVLSGCGTDARVAVLSAPRLQDSGTDLLEAARALLCEAARAQVQRVMLPWLYDAALPGDLLGMAFEAQSRGESFLWPARRECPAAFLSMDDLADLLYRLFENWQPRQEVLAVPDGFGLTMGRLADEVHALCPGAPDPDFADSAPDLLPPADGFLRRGYHWFPRFGLLEELPVQHQRWQELHGGTDTRRARAARWLARHPMAVRLAELGLGCLGAEALTRVCGAQMQFRLIDFRLLYIVLMGTVYGMQWGIAAAALASICLAAAYAGRNIGWLTLFYEPANWVVFIAYFTVGAVCGYVRGRSRDALAFAMQENETVRRKFSFLRQLYQQTEDRSREMRRQILSSQDSFGKIFRATRELDVAQPREIFFRAVQVLEDLLQNRSIAIYSVGANKSYARLEAASRPVARSLEQSLRMETLAPALPALRRGEVWVNREFLPGMPLFAAAARRDGEPVLLVEVCDAPYEQMTLYYQNLFKVLCGLVEAALLRAQESERLQRSEDCVPGTFRLLRPEAFRRQEAVAREMKQARMASYQLVRLAPCRATPEELDHALAGRIRENDAAGLMEDGCVWLLLTQATPQTLPFVVRRLEKAGFRAQVEKELPCTC